jgi:hypothetical protein
MKRARVGLLIAFLAFGLAEAPALAEEPRLSDAEFARLAQRLHVKSQTWVSVPWHTSVTEARQQAAREKKPIFFVVNTGNCLGYT